MKNKLLLFIFFLSFSYMYFMTSDIPFFWDDHTFNQDYKSRTISELIQQIFDFSSENALNSSRPTYALIFKFFFYFFQYDFVSFRIIKSILFGIVMILVLIINKEFIKDKFFSIFATLLFTFSFPIYTHTLIGFGPFLWAELIKLLVLVLFIKDLKSEKTSKITQFFIFILSFLMLRLYNNTASIIIIIFSYLFINPRFIKKYFILCIFLLLISFPFSMLKGERVGGPHKFNPENLNKVFLGFNLVELFILDISPSNLYYKPFLSIITVFGFWLLLASLLILFFNKWKYKKQIFSDETRKFLPFLIIWCLAEISLFLFLAEHAIRYTSAFLIPFYILFILIIYQTYLFLNKSRRFLTTIILVFSIIILINLEYSFAFRAGWGSNFIAREKTVEFFMQNNILSNETIILYNSAEVADMFIPINKSNDKYEIIFNNNFKRSQLEYFDQNNLKLIKTKYKNVYLIKIITAGGKEYPEIDFSQYTDAKLVTTIVGDSNDFFDKTRNLINSTGIWDIPYTKFEIYQIIS